MAKLISTYTVTEKLVSDSGTLPRGGTPPKASTWNVSISDTNNQAITVTGSTFNVNYPTVMVKRTNNVGEKNYAAANFGAQLLNPKSSSLWYLHLRRPNEKEYTWSSKMTQGTDIQVYRNYDVSGAQIALNTGDFFNGTNNRSRTVQLTWATILGSPGGTGDVTSSGLWSKYSKDGYTAYFATPSSAVTKSWNVTLTLNAPPSINSVSQSYSGPRTNGTSGNYYVKHTAYIINYSAGASYGGMITKATLSLGSYTVSKSNAASGQLVVTPTGAGTFTPTLTITDSRGQTTTRTFTAVTYVNPGVPSITASNATSSFPKDGFLKGLATASSAVTATSGINGGTIKTVKLEVGSYSGSRTGNGTVTTSVLNTVGTFTPKVTVTDNYGYSSSKNLAAITVINPPGPTFTAGNATSSTTNGFWKGYSKVKSVISSAKSGISDGTIKTITISAGGQSGSLSNVASGTVITSGRVNVSGAVTPSVTVTDNRGYSTTKNLSAVTFNIPTITASKVSVNRLNRETHKPDDAGLDALITATINRQAIDEGTTNFASILQPDVRIGSNGSPSSVTWYESYDKTAGTFASAINWNAYNPSANAVTIYGFAAYSDDVYVKTQDELIDPNKTYYTVNNKVYSAVEEPVVEDIKSYYEKTSGFKPDEAYNIAVRPKMGQVGTSTVITGAYIGDTLAPAFYLLAGLAGGRGLAIGRKAYDETFRVALPTYFEENVTLENASSVHLIAKTAYDTRAFLSVYDDGDTSAYGQMIRIGAGSKTIIGAGESAVDWRPTRGDDASEGMLPLGVIPTDTNENLYLVADGSIEFYTGSSNNGSSYSSATIDTEGNFHLFGGELRLNTRGTSSNDSGDIVWFYGNGQEKSRIWTANEYTAKSGPNYRVYNASGTQLYSGSLVLSDGTGASGTWGIDISGMSTNAKYLSGQFTVGGSTSHASSIQAWFNASKSSIPRDVLISNYSSAGGNGSMYMGYFLRGYDSNPYGGFFIAHYNNPRYVGIANGTYTQHDLLSNQNYTSYVDSVRDSANGTATTFNYSSAGLAYDKFTWLACWNGYQMRAVNKNVFAQASHSHSSLTGTGGITLTCGSATNHVYTNGYLSSAGSYTGTVSIDNRLAIASGGKIGRYASSSRRYKESIQDSKFDPHGLYKLPIRQFKYKDGYFSDEDENPRAYNIQVGFIAEEVKECFPAATVYDGEEIESWEERKIIPPMLQLIQEQHEEIEQLKSELGQIKEALS